MLGEYARQAGNPSHLREIVNFAAAQSSTKRTEWNKGDRLGVVHIQNDASWEIATWFGALEKIESRRGVEIALEEFLLPLVCPAKIDRLRERLASQLFIVSPVGVGHRKFCPKLRGLQRMRRVLGLLEFR